jgi:hypothetical protein
MMLEMIYISLQRYNTYKHIGLWQVKVLLVKLRTPYFKCFLSDCLQFHDYYYTLYPLICSTSSNCIGLDWENMEIKIPCVFFCHKQHILHNSSCVVLLKNGIVISHWRGVKKKRQTLVWIYGFRNKNGPNNPSWFIAHYTLCHGTC